MLPCSLKRVLITRSPRRGPRIIRWLRSVFAAWAGCAGRPGRAGSSIAPVPGHQDRGGQQRGDEGRRQDPCRRLVSIIAAVAEAEISMETVKPIPPRSETPKISIHVTKRSSLARVVLVRSQTVPRIPTGLPTTKAMMIPRVTEFDSREPIPALSPTCTPAAKKANTGTAIPAETGRSRCSRISANPPPGCGPLLESTSGTAKPRRTPATVA